jgi:signal transduction histidine kinase
MQRGRVGLRQKRAAVSAVTRFSCREREHAIQNERPGGAMSITANDDGGFLSKVTAGSREQRLCFSLIGASALVFVACIPHVRVPLEPSPAFVAVYNGVSSLSDFMTGIILIGQFNILRSRALLMLAGGYLFASAMSAIQLLTFPGMFSATGLLGAGPQTTLWLCIFWHGGFPIAVIAYALSADTDRESASSPRIAIATVIIAIIGAVLACWFAATWGTENERVLPSLLDASGFTVSQRVVILANIALTLWACVPLWRRRRQSLLDLWLMVVMGYLLCDISLSSYLNATRYDLGFYAGRLYGLLAASFVLAALVLENSRLHHRLALAASGLKERARSLSQANERMQNEMTGRERAEEKLHQAQAELARVSRMSAMGELTSSLAHEVNHPIGAIMINAETCLRWLSHEVPNVERARAIANMIVKDGARASETVGRMQQLFRKRALFRQTLDLNEIIREMIALLDPEAARCSVSIQADLMADPPKVSGDRAQLKQVLMNLMINGIEAMSEIDGARELLIRSEQVEGGDIAISVSDTGIGLPPLPSTQLFNSFVTTKPNSIGIGLSISRSIIEEHGGRLWATNNAPRGAHFHLTLPAEA